MRNKGIAHLLLVILMAAHTCPAVEGGQEELPPLIQAHIVVKSLDTLVEHLDDFVAGVTAPTKNPIPPGFVTMISAMAIPFPRDAWRTNEPIHILFPITALFHGVKEAAVMLYADDFDAFVKAFENVGAEVEEREDDNASGRRSVDVDHPNMGRFIAVDLGDGRIGLCQNESALKSAFFLFGKDPWRPAPYAGAADISATIRMASLIGLTNLGGLDKLVESIQRDRERGPSNPNLNSEVMIGFADYLIHVIPQIKEQIQTFKTIGLDLAIDADVATLVMRGGFADNSLPRLLAEHAMKLDSADNPLVDRIGEDAFSLGVIANLYEAVPDLRDRVSGIAGDFVRIVFPKHLDRFEKAFDGLLSAAGGSVVGNYGRPGQAYGVTWISTERPDELLGALDELCAVINAMLDETIVNPAYRVSLKRDTVDVGGIECVGYRLAFEDPDMPESFLENLSLWNPELSSSLEEYGDFAFFIGSVDGAVVTASGQVDLDEFEALLTEDPDPEFAFVNRDGVDAVADFIEPAQMARSFIDADKLFAMVFTQAIVTYAQSGEVDAEDFLDAMEKALPRLRDSGECLGLGLGARDHQLSATLSLTTHAIGAMIANYEIFSAILREGESQDALDDEGGSDGFMEETFELDEPADAS